jgi:hypothetical protein
MVKGHSHTLPHLIGLPLANETRLLGLSISQQSALIDMISLSESITPSLRNASISASAWLDNFR